MVGNCSYQHLLRCLIFSCYGNVFFMINVKMETTGKNTNKQPITLLKDVSCLLKKLQSLIISP